MFKVKFLNGITVLLTALKNTQNISATLKTIYIYMFFLFVVFNSLNGDEEKTININRTLVNLYIANFSFFILILNLHT